MRLTAKVQFTLEFPDDEDVTEKGIIDWIQSEIGGNYFKVELRGQNMRDETILEAADTLEECGAEIKRLKRLNQELLDALNKALPVLEKNTDRANLRPDNACETVQARALERMISAEAVLLGARIAIAKAKGQQGEDTI